MSKRSCDLVLFRKKLEKNGIEPKRIPNNEVLEKVRLAKEGDEEAFREILLDSLPLIYRVLSKYFFRGGEIDDVYQECCIALMKAIKTFDPKKVRGSFRGFVALCLENKIITQIRMEEFDKRKTLNESFPLDEGFHTRLNFSTKDFPTNLVQKDHEEFLLRAIGKYLSKYESKVFYLRYIKQLSYKEISETMNLGKDDKSVDNAIDRIRSKIKKYKKAFVRDVDVEPVNFPFSHLWYRSYRIPGSNGDFFSDERDWEDPDTDSFGYWSVACKQMEENFGA